MLYLTNIEPLDKNIEPLEKTTCRVTLEDNGKPLCYELDVSWRRDGTPAWVDIPRRMYEDLLDYAPQGYVRLESGAIDIPAIWNLASLIAGSLMGQSLTLPMRIDDIKEPPLIVMKDDGPSAVLLLTHIEPLDKTTCRVRLEDNGKPLCYDLEVEWNRNGTLAGVDIPSVMFFDLEHYEPQVDWSPAQGALYIPAIQNLETLLYRFLTGTPLTLPMRIDNIRRNPAISVKDD